MNTEGESCNDDEKQKYQSSHKMKYRLSLIASKEVHPVTMMESVLKTSRHVTARQKR